MGKPSDITLSLADVWRSWLAFRSGKKASHAILEFEQHLPENILRLCADLNNGRYEHGRYDHKIVNEKKRRDIAVAPVRDRIVHRLLYDHLVRVCDSRFDYDVWSCRVGKGTVSALQRTKALLTKYPDAYVWRGDIVKFFDHIDHDVLRVSIGRYNIGQKAYLLLDKIISSYTIIKTDRQVCPLAI